MARDDAQEEAGGSDSSAVGGGGWRIVLGCICPFRCRKVTHPGTRHRPVRVSEVQGHSTPTPLAQTERNPRESAATELEFF